jgi:superfamily II DNA or RNA helicase
MMQRIVAPAFGLYDVRKAFAPEVYARGEAYVREGRVSALTIASDGHAITADVAGTSAAPYHVQVFISRARSGRNLISGYCQCPIGMECKHVAATLIAAFERGNDPQRGNARSTEVVVPPHLERATRAERVAPRAAPARDRGYDDTAVDRWISQLREAAAPAAAADFVGDERIAYVVGGRAATGRYAFPVEIVVVRRAKARWTKLRAATVDSLVAAAARSVRPEDAVIGRFLQVFEHSYGAAQPLAGDILQRIVATGRAHLDRFDGVPLVLGSPRAARIVWSLGHDGTQRPTVVFDEPATRVLPGPAAWYADGESGLAGPIDAGMPAPALAALLAAPAIDARQAKRVRDAFRNSSGELAVPAPLDVVERIVRVKPVPTLTLRTVSVPGHYAFTDDASAPVDIAEYSFAYGPVLVKPQSSGDEVRQVSGVESLVYPRSRGVEDKANRRLMTLDLENDPALHEHLGAAPNLCLRFPPELQQSWRVFVHRVVPELRADGWQVTIDPSFRYRIVDLSDDGVWEPRVAETSDGWFDLGIGLDVDGKHVDLLAILGDLLQRNDSLSDPDVLAGLGPDEFFYIAFADSHTSLAFPAARLRAIVTTLVELYDPEALRARGALRLPAVRAGVVADLEAAVGLRWDVPERLRTLAERLRDFAGVERVDVPASLHGELRPYQRDGLDWLQFLTRYGFGGILADDMGLGKSVQTLAHLLCEKEAGRLTQPALLVVPTSLVHNWCDEAARFAPALRMLPLHGPTRAERFAQIDAHDVVITTYALLARDAVLRERSWHAVILDEAQALKNPQAKIAQIALGLRAEHRLCLTGTPVENHLGDLWSLFSIALPGALGDRKHFGRVFRTPIEKHADAQRRGVLAQRIAPFLLRRTKEAVAAELPAKTEIVQRVELSGAQRDLYETVRLAMHRRVREEIEQRGLARSQIVILDALLKLRQVCCDPRLLPKPLHKAAPSVKLDHLLGMVPQMVEEGRRILIFSQFTSMLDLIAPALAAVDVPFVVLTGKTTDRASVVRRFTGGDVPVFLISLKAGGTGLNLTAADTVIHYDPWWNPAVERQATDRAHRIGQHKHVFVYKLIGAGTVEEKIVDLQVRKAQLAAAIFAEKSAGHAHFAVEDVERLFAPLEPEADG